jgi:hypothetical protein
MIMEALINAYNWQMDKQNFLPITGTGLTLSVCPEYTYWIRDENGMLSRSRIAQGIKLNCAIQSKRVINDNTEYCNETYIEFGSEEEFYDYMIGLKKCFQTLEHC